MKTALLLFLSLLAFLQSGIVAAEPSASSPKSLKVGLILGISGHAAYHSDAIRKGVQLAAETLEAKGWNVKLEVEDDQTNPAKTVSSLKFLLAEGYTFFIGPTWSFQANAARPVLEKAGALALIPAGSSDINGGASDALLNLSPARRQQTPVLAEWLKDKSFSSGYIVTPNGDWGEIHRQVFAEALDAAKISIAGKEMFDFGSDFETIKALMLRVKESTPGILLVTGAGSDVANFVKARNELKLPFAILSTNDIRDAVAMKLVTAADLRNNVFAMALRTSPAFDTEYRARYQEPTKLYSERGYDALMILAEAVQKTDGSVAAVKQYLHGNFHFEGAAGKIEFTKDGDVREGTYYVANAADLIETP